MGGRKLTNYITRKKNGGAKEEGTGLPNRELQAGELLRTGASPYGTRDTKLTSGQPWELVPSLHTPVWKLPLGVPLELVCPFGWSSGFWVVCCGLSAPTCPGVKRPPLMF